LQERFQKEFGQADKFLQEIQTPTNNLSSSVLDIRLNGRLQQKEEVVLEELNVAFLILFCSNSPCEFETLQLLSQYTCYEQGFAKATFRQ